MSRHLVQLGLGCNNRCVFCAQRGLAIADAPSDAWVRTALERGRAEGHAGVAFVGGEPTLHAELPAWVERAHTLGFSDVRVQTNARMLAYPTYLGALTAARLTGVEVSLQGPAPAVHDYHTRVPGSFRQTVKGLLNVRGTAVEAAITTVVTRSNFRNLEELAELVAAVEARAWLLAAARPLGEAAAQAPCVIPAPEMILPPVARAAERARRAGVLVATDEAPLPRRFIGLGQVA